MEYCFVPKQLLRLTLESYLKGGSLYDGRVSLETWKSKKKLLFHVIKLTKTESIVFVVVSAEWARLKSHSLKILLSGIIYSVAASGEGVVNS